MELTDHNPWYHAPSRPLLRVRAPHTILRHSSNAPLHWRRRCPGAPWSPHSGLGCRPALLAPYPWPWPPAVAVAAKLLQRVAERQKLLFPGSNGHLPVKGQAAVTNRVGTGAICLRLESVCQCLQLVDLPLQSTDLFVLLTNYGSAACQHVLPKDWCAMLAY